MNEEVTGPKAGVTPGQAAWMAYQLTFGFENMPLPDSERERWGDVAQAAIAAAPVPAISGTVPGRVAYEAFCAADGDPRPCWDSLSSVERGSWQVVESTVASHVAAQQPGVTR